MIVLEKITDYMSVDLIDLDLKSNNKADVLKELNNLLNKSGKINNKEKCLETLNNREKLGSTGIGKGVAIPHAKTEYADDLTIAFGISKKGIDFDSVDSDKVGIFFVFASPLKNSRTYLKILARISRLIRNEEFRDKLKSAKNSEEILNIIDTEEKC